LSNQFKIIIHCFSIPLSYVESHHSSIHLFFTFYTVCLYTMFIISPPH
jgi:hypothetical protein